MSAPTLKPGGRLRSQVSEVEVVVVRPPSSEVVLSCGGETMVDVATEAPPVGSPADGEPTVLGKRYVDDESGLELLCTKGGAGSLSADGRALTVKGAKPLPSSD
jgi:hypothetical protein